MFKFLKRLFSEPVGYDPTAVRATKRQMRECGRYYAEGRDRSTGLSWVQNQVIEEGLQRVIEMVSREYIANEGSDIEGLMKHARYQVGKKIREDWGYHPVGKAFNDYCRDMPASLLLNAEALQVLHNRVEPMRDFVSRFGESGLTLLEDYQAGKIPDPRKLPVSKIKAMGY